MTQFFLRISSQQALQLKHHRSRLSIPIVSRTGQKTGVARQTPQTGTIETDKSHSGATLWNSKMDTAYCLFCGNQTSDESVLYCSTACKHSDRIASPPVSPDLRPSLTRSSSPSSGGTVVPSFSLEIMNRPLRKRRSLDQLSSYSIGGSNTPNHFHALAFGSSGTSLRV
ncbi:hypothetical protein SeMB42_g05642 [Synchytrium endobioticum]|uniref:Uncharacterized protein n=1 Tax=Synchytrium endobioticum TaxID=286115 RepID=A0A507D570_9FUNG|nr:hypothetical protein SeMB42_g05642 [Synchytrium endobioticum]TPX46465.1 hypothetical protein SeLEV6574_g03216 [Synchytrium endobioticum]